MFIDQLSRLTIARYRLCLSARQAAVLPQFLGSTLRGAFGHALKNAVCVMNHRNCERCLVVDRCFYPYLFDTPVPPGLPELRGQQQAPHPFILVPPVSNSLTQKHQIASGEEIAFGLVLMGRAIEMMPYVIYAVGEMARGGLGASRIPFELSDVTIINPQGEYRSIYSSRTQRLASGNKEEFGLDNYVKERLNRAGSVNGLKLRFLTPARIRVQGDLQAELNFDLLMRNLLRRLSMLFAVHGQARLELDYRGLIERAASVRTKSSELTWWDWERYSNRQQTKMNLGGFVGEVEYEGEAVAELMPLLIAGELLHIGNGTSFGLGLYEVVV